MPDLKRPFAILLAVSSVSGLDGADTQFFDDRVAPILRTRCVGCHNDELKAGGVSFLGRDTLLRQGRRGTVIVPGRPNESLLIQSVRQDGDVKMPPGAKLSSEEIATLVEWIDRGAPWGTQLKESKAPQQLPFEIWRFDRIDKIGDHAATVLGHPRLIETSAGRAVEFNGVDDALVLDIHPLAGAQTFTWEVVFRPDLGGAAMQRFMHFQQRDRAADLLFEIRVIEDRWCLNSFARSGKLYPLGAWHHVAMIYDGREFRTYVDGELQAAAELKLAPQAAGHASAGAGINRRDYFKGAIRLARMTRGVLSPSEFATAHTEPRP